MTGGAAPDAVSDTVWDYVIVGGGTAGCVLAGRLTEEPGTKVLLIEAGPDYPPGQEPADIRDTYYTTFFRPDNFWPQLRAHFTPVADSDPPTPRRYEQARVIGGGSSINAMIALRGMPQDFAEWVEMGASGWDWDNVFPHYRKLETDLDFDGDYHGKDGPIAVRRHRRDQWPGFCQGVADAVEELYGFSHVEDMNGPVEEGYCSVPISSRPEHRTSAAMGYLTDRVRKRPNLRILANTQVDRILFDGAKATGVSTVGGESHRGAEIVVSAGALMTPALLIRSGVGPADAISAIGGETVADRPGVGANLQDHPAVSMAAYLKPKARQPRSLRPAPNVALRYTSNTEGCGTSDMYVSVTNKSSWHPLGQCLGGLVCCIYKPMSRGRVTVTDPDPQASPLIEFNLLSDQRDTDRLVAALRMADAIYRHPALAGMIHEFFPASYSERFRDLNRYGPANWARSMAARLLLDGPAALRRYLIRTVVAPGDDADTLMADDAELRAWVRARAVPFYHPVGTCRIGQENDPKAVVDPACRVYGVSNLRVIDASIMPTVTRANTNLTVAMIGEKMAQDMREAA